jgi:DnaJ-class molecular chaperone
LRVSIRFLEAILGATRRIALPDESAIEVEIPAGVRDGQVLRIRRPGPSAVGESAELLVGVSVEASHWLFTRQGDDVHLELSITPAEAAQGAKVRLPAPTGVIVLTTPREARDGATLRLKGKGVPGRGDQLVRLKVMTSPPVADPVKLAEEVQRARAEMEAWHAFDLGHCEGPGQRYAQALVGQAPRQGADGPGAGPLGSARSP